MSNTRHTSDPDELNQERFCSSPEHEQGLLANLVAKRAKSIFARKHLELLFFLQHASHQPGGLKALAQRIVGANQDKIGTRALLASDLLRRGMLPAEIAQRIRMEIPNCFQAFPMDTDLEGGRISYTFADFKNHCLEAAKAYDRELMKLCLDPAIDVESFAPFYFPDALQVLEREVLNHAHAQEAAFVSTEVSRQLFESFEYAESEGCLVLVEGRARIGKTHSARAWCERFPGRARYVQVPATNDDIGFFRAIARALGVGAALSMKGVQMRERVEYVLQESRLMLVLDESHYCWPQNNRKEALPNRINWLLTALVNHGVPVCLVSTPQFTADQKIVEKKTGWTSEQFIGRIGHYQKLPETLAPAELTLIAQSLLPGADDPRSVEALVCYAESSRRYVAGIESTVKRARYLAKKAGRENILFKDVAEALRTSVMPSDAALFEAQSQHEKRKPRERAAAPLMERAREIDLPSTRQTDAEALSI